VPFFVPSEFWVITTEESKKHDQEDARRRCNGCNWHALVSVVSEEIFGRSQTGETMSRVDSAPVRRADQVSGLAVVYRLGYHPAFRFSRAMSVSCNSDLM